MVLRPRVDYLMHVLKISFWPHNISVNICRQISLKKYLVLDVR